MVRAVAMMSGGSAVAVWRVVAVVAAVAASWADGECSTGRSVAVSVRHSTNATGHPQLTARLEHPPDNAPWQLNIELGTSCLPVNQPNKVISVTLNGVSYQPRPPTPSGYRLLPGLGHYRAATQAALTWVEARDACAAEGATLVTPASEREATVLVKEFPANASGATSDSYIWFGLHDFEQEGKFVSLAGVPLELTGFSKWHPGQPDGGAGESCMVIVRTNVLLADAPCSWTLSYICKIPL